MSYSFQNPSQDIIFDYLKMLRPLQWSVCLVEKRRQPTAFPSSCRKRAIKLFQLIPRLLVGLF